MRSIVRSCHWFVGSEAVLSEREVHPMYVLGNVIWKPHRQPKRHSPHFQLRHRSSIISTLYNAYFYLFETLLMRRPSQGEGKAASVHITKEYVALEVELHPFSTSALYGDDWSHACPRLFRSGEKQAG